LFLDIPSSLEHRTENNWGKATNVESFSELWWASLDVSHIQATGKKSKERTIHIPTPKNK
jgi:hypothetical protein